jgi:hypothetical protein
MMMMAQMQMMAQFMQQNQALMAQQMAAVQSTQSNPEVPLHTPSKMKPQGKQVDLKSNVQIETLSTQSRSQDDKVYVSKVKKPLSGWHYFCKEYADKLRASGTFTGITQAT